MPTPTSSSTVKPEDSVFALFPPPDDVSRFLGGRNFLIEHGNLQGTFSPVEVCGEWTVSIRPGRDEMCLQCQLPAFTKFTASSAKLSGLVSPQDTGLPLDTTLTYVLSICPCTFESGVMALKGSFICGTVARIMPKWLADYLARENEQTEAEPTKVSIGPELGMFRDPEFIDFTAPCGWRGSEVPVDVRLLGGTEQFLGYFTETGKYAMAPLPV